MKKLTTLTILLFSSTMFAPGNQLEEPAQDVQGARCCMNTYCLTCTLCCLYCCWPKKTDPVTCERILPETHYTPSNQREKME